MLFRFYYVLKTTPCNPEVATIHQASVLVNFLPEKKIGVET
jgi:hypothetical protein